MTPLADMEGTKMQTLMLWEGACSRAGRCCAPTIAGFAGVYEQEVLSDMPVWRAPRRNSAIQQYCCQLWDWGTMSRAKIARSGTDA